MQVAITGGTGCLGQPLVDKLLKNDITIKLLCLPNDPVLQKIEEKVHIITGNLNCVEALNLLTKDCEIVFHLAGKVHSIPKTKVEERDFYRVNVEGTKLLLKAVHANKVKRVIFISTVGVYGKETDFHGDEVSACQPISVYAKSKYQAEQLVLNYIKKGEQEGVILRFPVVYGPFDKGNVANLIKAIHNKFFFYFGKGDCLHSMISSKNAAEATFKGAFEPQAANKVFCVTDGKDYILKEVVEAICYALNTNWRPFHIPISIAKLVGKLGDVIEKSSHIPFPINSTKVKKLSLSLTFSCEKARKILGYKPVEILIDGIFREVRWLKKAYGWK